MDSFLNLMSQGSDDQIATEPDGWIGAIELQPSKPQIGRRLINQSGNLLLDRGIVRTRSVVPVTASTGNGRRPASALASRSVVP
jgi:hypothetical protein